ncbi:glycosyltransferase family 2 protein [Pseudomonas fulva]|uniref:glycosyltransferase family 2 protein n=1 Tax=Pseudomonas fulva TaxID=47880 RepID=UPI003D080F23
MTEYVMEQPQTEVSAIQPHFSGAILGLQGDVLHGWAMDNTQQEHRPVIEVFVDGASVALVRADQYEPSAPAGDRFHGFAVQLRQSWLDEARLITARIANQSYVLEGPLSLPIIPSEDVAGLASQVWHAGGLRIAGWCWDPKAPSRHVQVTVREGGLIISQALCNEHNQALAYRATSDHGFAIDLPWELADGNVHLIEIVNDKNQVLSGSPVRICCWPEGIEGLIRQLGTPPNPPVLELLNAVSREQSIRLPKGASWESYPQWFRLFQSLDGQDAPALQGKLGVLLITEGNKEREKHSLSSLTSCREAIHEIVYASPSHLKPSIEKLLASGCDRILPIHAGDRLAAFGLEHLSATLEEGIAWAYADCDQDGPNMERTSPWLKPVWNIDLFLGADLFTPGAIFSKQVVNKALLLLATRNEELCIGLHDFVAGIALATEHGRLVVAHLPLVLYHRAAHTPASPEQAMPSRERLMAIEWLCNALAPGATANPMTKYPALIQVQWPLPKKLPRVSLIVPTRNHYKLLRNCVEGLLTNTDYPNLEIIVVDNQSSDIDTLTYLEKIKDRGVIVIGHNSAFNYSEINNRAVSLATGEVIGLVNNDIEIIESSWLKHMVSQLSRSSVGIVGAKLLWPNGMVQHAGVTVGVNGLAAHIGNNWSDDDAGYLGLNQLARQASAVTAACLLTKAEVYKSLGGLDANRFPVAFNDVDFCMRVLRSGLQIIWTPFAKLIHAESASRGKDISAEKKARAMREQEQFMLSWTLDGWQDPYFHPSLAADYLSGPFGALALPPRYKPMMLRGTDLLSEQTSPWK